MFNLNDADYHLHTYYSDGEFSPSYVVEKFAAMGIEHLAITDHDGIGGVLEGEKKARELGIDFRRGIEFSTSGGPGGSEVHMLGYDIDIENEELLSRVDDVRKKRRERNEFFIKELTDMGMPVTYEELLLANGQEYIGKPVFARVLLEKGYISTFSEAFSEKVFGSERLNPVRKKDAPTEEIIGVIIRAGGIPVLAHPGLIEGMGERGSEEFYENIEAFAQSLVPYGLKGMECIYRKHSEEENERFIEIAEKLGLYISKGSDFHNEREEER